MRKLIATAHINNTCGIGIIDIEYGITDKIIYTFLGIPGMNKRYEAEIDYDYEEEEDTELTPFFIDKMGYKWFLSEFIITDF